MSVAPGVEGDLIDLLYDPQTSGGLLIAVDEPEAGALAAALEAGGVLGSRIGRAVAPGTTRISVL